MSREPHDLTEAIVRLEHLQNALRTISLYPHWYDADDLHLHEVFNLITALTLRVDQWAAAVPTGSQRERRYHERRQADRRQPNGDTDQAA